jgi:hypothetical protein
MKLPTRVRQTVWMSRALLGVVVIACTAGFLDAQNRATPSPPAVPKGDVQGAALQEFQRRLNGYVELRTKLAHDLRPLKPTASASELSARQESLAAAIRQTRKNARMGDLIPAPAAELLRRTIQSDFKGRSPETRKAAVSEVTEGVTPVINRTFPARAALPTIPPLLLAKLPLLPDNLQYRFLNRDLVILDGDTELIIDYVPSVLPPR